MTASRRLSIFGFLTLLALLAGLAAATQDIATAFHYPRIRRRVGRRRTLASLPALGLLWLVRALLSGLSTRL